MPCSNAPATVVIDGTEKPTIAGRDGNSFEVSTGTLGAGTHKVVLRCGDKNSADAILEVVPSPAIDAPRVVCAQNISPRDGAPSSEADSQAESSEQGARPTKPAKPSSANCDAKSIWTVRLEDTLAVRIAGYDEWATLKRENAAAPLHVFVEGIELDNLRLRAMQRDPASDTATFWTTFRYETDGSKTDTRDRWAQILRMARRNDSLAISAGPSGGPQWATSAAIKVNSYPTLLSWIAATVIGGLAVGLAWAARKTPLLRDFKDGPYSLARHQMAVWFLVVVSAYLFVTMTTGAAAATSTTALALIGISGATGLGAVLIDRQKRNASESERRNLQDERDTLIKLIGDDRSGLQAQLNTAAADSAERAQLAAAIQSKSERLEAVKALLAQSTPPKAARSRGWLNDLLGDEDGVSFHRLQIAVWTIVLVVTFVMAVWRTFAMPEFDATTLGLMGISSGTYLGFKIPERES